MKVRYVSFKPAPPAEKAPPRAAEAPPEHVTLPGSGSRDLVLNHPCADVCKPLREITPGPRLPGHSTSDLITPAPIASVVKADVPFAHSTPLPAFSSWPRVPGML